MHPKLAWIPEFQSCLSGAMGSSVTASFVDHVDPLKKLVVLVFADGLKKGDYKHIQILAHGFAKANDCVLERIRRQQGSLVLEILVKRRLGPVHNKNPL